jgi:Skp family chaperone for outer membrane proteins
MAKAIKAVGERENYTYIFDSQAMVHIGNDAVDATPAVKKELGIK